VNIEIGMYQLIDGHIIMNMHSDLVFSMRFSVLVEHMIHNDELIIFGGEWTIEHLLGIS